MSAHRYTGPALITGGGDGCQVRDVLYVQDMVNALLAASRQCEELTGCAFNIGGGPANTLSLLELLMLMKEQLGLQVPTQFGAWRKGDQRYYVSDTRRFETATGWRPQVTAVERVKKLCVWLDESMPPVRGRQPASVVSR
jgi:CDP-paratose 2-epimerase